MYQTLLVSSTPTLYARLRGCTCHHLQYYFRYFPIKAFPSTKKEGGRPSFARALRLQPHISGLKPNPYICIRIFAPAKMTGEMLRHFTIAAAMSGEVLPNFTIGARTESL